MTSQIISVLVAGVLGVVAFIVVRAIVFATGIDACGDTLSCVQTTGVVSGTCGEVECWNDTGDACSGVFPGIANGSMVRSNLDCWTGAECVLTVIILPLTIAIFVVVLVLMGLTRIRAPG